jgi:L-alanine-DL-glutamate epimerase-like enolase superfamily enzyme
MKLDVFQVNWPLKVPFTISRDTQHEIPCIQVRLSDGWGHVGRGEAVGVDYAGETPASLLAEISAIRARIEAGVSRDELQMLLPAGGARNALDCALWDLEAKQCGQPVWRLAGLPSPSARPTAFTLGIMSETGLRAAASAHAHFQLLKIKTDRAHGLDPVRIVHEVAPSARLIVDPNASWGADELRRFAPELTALNVALLEQPLAPQHDEVLRGMKLPVPIAADEAFDDRSSLAGLAGKYQVLNIKLDKTGGLTEALACAREGQAQGFRLMIGCMVGSSLSMAPGTLIAQLCDFADLDGPLLQSADCDHPIVYRDGMIGVPSPELWG